MLVLFVYVSPFSVKFETGYCDERPVVVSADVVLSRRSLHEVAPSNSRPHTKRIFQSSGQTMQRSTSLPTITIARIPKMLSLRSKGADFPVNCDALTENYDINSCDIHKILPTMAWLNPLEKRQYISRIPLKSSSRNSCCCCCPDCGCWLPQVCTKHKMCPYCSQLVKCCNLCGQAKPVQLCRPMRPLGPCAGCCGICGCGCWYAGAPSCFNGLPGNCVGCGCDPCGAGQWGCFGCGQFGPFGCCYSRAPCTCGGCVPCTGPFTCATTLCNDENSNQNCCQCCNVVNSFEMTTPEYTYEPTSPDCKAWQMNESVKCLELMKNPECECFCSTCRAARARELEDTEEDDENEAREPNTQTLLVINPNLAKNFPFKQLE